MSTDAILRLETLRCIGESDGSGGSEPYLWFALVWVDAQTLATPGRIGLTAINSGSARRVVRGGMRAGQSAPVPAGASTLRVRLEDGRRNFRRLLPIVALWENDETPDDALRAGYRAWVDGLNRELSAAFDAALRPGGPSLESLLPAALGRVAAGLGQAISDALSGWERFELAIGSLNLDDFVAMTGRVWTGQIDERFVLTLRKPNDPNHYELDVAATLKPVVIDPCQGFVNEVREIEAAIEGVQAEIRALQEQLSGGSEPGDPTLPKAAIIAEIRRLREEDLPPLLQALDQARARLEQCRNRPRPPVVVGDLADLVVTRR